MPKKIVITKLGGPEVLQYVKYELPIIIADDYVRIKQTSIGLNYIDTYHRSGVYPLPKELPFCPGLEGSGEVIDIGKNVNEFFSLISVAAKPRHMRQSHRQDHAGIGLCPAFQEFPHPKNDKCPERFHRPAINSLKNHDRIRA